MADTEEFPCRNLARGQRPTEGPLALRRLAMSRDVGGRLALSIAGAADGHDGDDALVVVCWPVDAGGTVLPGSLRTMCSSCSRPCWISPVGAESAAANAPYVVRCPKCASVEPS